MSVITKSLYHRMYQSYLLQRPEVIDNYNLLKDQYKSNPDSFSCLNKFELIRLKKVQEDIKKGSYSLFNTSLDLSPELPEALKKEKTDKKHKDLCKSIIKNPSILEPFTGPIDFINTEHPTKFGPIDICVWSKRIAYIIELKTKSATHEIIGQVQKYFIGLSLHLILNLFDDIKIITLCPGYDQPSYSGLLRINAKPLIIKSNPLKIKELGF